LDILAVISNESSGALFQLGTEKALLLGKRSSKDALLRWIFAAILVIIAMLDSQRR
jgi:hypothetical protein